MDLVKTLKSSSTTMRRCRLPVDARTFWLWLASTSQRRRRSQRWRCCCCCSCCFATIVSGVSFLKNCSEMLGKGLCGECVHNTYVCGCVYVCMCLWNTVRRHVCMYAVRLLLLLCLHLLLCDFLVVNSCQTHKGETSLKGFVVTSTYSRAAVAASAAHSLTHTQWVDVKFSASLLHQQIRIHYTVLQYVRQFVPPSSSSRWHSLGNGTRSSASSKLWMEILDEIYLNISNIVFPTSCHWNSLTQGITKYYQSQITIHIPWAISISCGRWYKWDMIV